MPLHVPETVTFSTRGCVKVQANAPRLCPTSSATVQQFENAKPCRKPVRCSGLGCFREQLGQGQVPELHAHLCRTPGLGRRWGEKDSPSLHFEMNPPPHRFPFTSEG